jgi:ketoreductase RED2
VVVNSATSVDAGQAASTSLPGESIYVKADISIRSEALALSMRRSTPTAGSTTSSQCWVDHHGSARRHRRADRGDLPKDLRSERLRNVDIKHAIPHLRQSDDPCIVNITSIAGVRPVGSSVAYSMSKAALNHMTLLLAKSYGPVRVKAVAPGLVATPWAADWEETHKAVAARAPTQICDPTTAPKQCLQRCGSVSSRLLSILGGTSRRRRRRETAVSSIRSRTGRRRR